MKKVKRIIISKLPLLLTIMRKRRKIGDHKKNKQKRKTNRKTKIRN